MADPNKKLNKNKVVRLAPFQEEYLSDIFASAKALTGEGSQMPYADQQVAGLSDAQQQAITSAMQGVGSFQPYLQQGSQALGTGNRGSWYWTWNYRNCDRSSWTSRLYTYFLSRLYGSFYRIRYCSTTSRYSKTRTNATKPTRWKVP